MSKPRQNADAAPVPPAVPVGTVVGLLHTVPGLAPRFDADLAAALPGSRRVHVVDAWLLATAIRDGVTDGVRAAVLEHLRHLEAVGAGAVLVTCSSIGEAAEGAAVRVHIPVVRVDAAMAREAVSLAGAPSARGRVAVLATLASTLGPTQRLVERAAEEAGIARAAGDASAVGDVRGAGQAGPADPVRVTAEVVAGAAALRDAGDGAGADRLVADAIAAAAGSADVVLLAQASMAGAAELAGATVPVLSSPAGGVADLVRAVTGPCTGPRELVAETS